MIETVQGSDDIHRYVDGEMTPDEAARFEAWLAQTPDAAREVAELQRLNAMIAGGIPQPDPAHLDRLLLHADQAARAPSALRRMAAALLLLGIGFGAGFAVPSGNGFVPMTGPYGGIMQQASAAYGLYSVEAVHPVEVSAKDRDHLDAWLSKRLGAAIVAPSMSKSPYRLIGGRLLPADTQPAALYMYENDRGERISLYAKRLDQDRETPFQFDTVNGISVVYWSEGQWGYVLSGRNADELRDLAPSFWGELI